VVQLEWLGMEEVRFGQPVNAMKRQKSVLACLEWFSMEYSSFGLTQMAWIGGSRVWPDWNGLE
jgi:hypothetical protein